MSQTTITAETVYSSDTFNKLYNQLLTSKIPSWPVIQVDQTSNHPPLKCKTTPATWWLLQSDLG